MELKYNPKEPTSKKGMPREMFMNWGGWFPHPELDRDIPLHPRKVSETVAQTLVDPPPAVKYMIPNGINLPTFRRHGLSCPESLSVSAIDAHASVPELLKAVATEDKKLISKKPLDGIHAFVWRVALYAAGLNRAIPVTAFWDLEEGVLKLTGTLGVTDEVVRFLEHRAAELVVATGGNQHAAQVRWARYLGRAV